MEFHAFRFKYTPYNFNLFRLPLGHIVSARYLLKIEKKKKKKKHSCLLMIMIFCRYIRIFAVVLILDMITELGVSAYSLTDIKTLKKELLTDTVYDRKIRPTLDQTKPTEVCYFLFVLLKAISVSFFTQSAKS